MTPSNRSLFFLRALVLIVVSVVVIPMQAQSQAETSHRRATDPDYVKRRADWFYRGRVLRGQSAAKLRHRAYQDKLRLRAAQAAVFAATHANAQGSLSSGSWTPLGPAPLAS